MTADEFFHFLEERCIYTHDSGDIIEIEPHITAVFAKDWKSTCRVKQTIRKVYMIQ